MEGKPNQLYAQGMRSFEQYDEICKYFAEGKQRDNNANEIQKHLQLYDLSLGEYLVNKFALWLPNHGCSVKHPKWRICFCGVLD